MDQSKSKAGSRSRSGSNAATDAIALLKADHRQVEKWFSEFDSARSEDRKAKLATSICRALQIHTALEEEIFYPAFLEASGDSDLHHEAIVEHEGAKRLIQEIESGGSDDEFFDARVSVLSEMVKHHVKEEEKPSGMFAEAKKCGMDLKQLGERLKARKQELEQGGVEEADEAA